MRGLRVPTCLQSGKSTYNLTPQNCWEETLLKTYSQLTYIFVCFMYYTLYSYNKAKEKKILFKKLENTFTVLYRGKKSIYVDLHIWNLCLRSTVYILQGKSINWLFFSVPSTLRPGWIASHKLFAYHPIEPISTSPAGYQSQAIEYCVLWATAKIDGVPYIYIGAFTETLVTWSMAEG